MGSELERTLETLREMRSTDFWHEFLRNHCYESREALTKETVKEKSREETIKMSAIGLPFESPFPAPGQLPQSPSSASAQFASSAFYDQTRHPSITDQVVLCREIAKQLVSDEMNAKSKGRQMFEKRVQKSSKWITSTTGQDDVVVDDRSEEDYHQTTISEGPPRLRLLLDPRHVQDWNSCKFESNISEDSKKEELSRDFAHDLMASPESQSKGNALFAKRQQKSEQWVVESLAQTVVESAHQKVMTTTVADDPPPPPVVLPLKTSEEFGFVSRFQSLKDFNARAKPFCRMY